MKLKYYLRGLGVGIICTAILMGIALSGNKKEKLTDTEIIERAKLLGMVMADESSEAGGTDAEGQDAKSKNQPGQNAEAKDPSKQDTEDPSETGVWGAGRAWHRQQKQGCGREPAWPEI